MFAYYSEASVVSSEGAASKSMPPSGGDPARNSSRRRYASVSGQRGEQSHQLRQKVAFALSQIFVTSLDKLIWNGNMASYQDTLLADAFGNYRQIMKDVTLSPAMGQYLDMGNNAKADPTTGSVANENYARELMQLFTIGTAGLNPDGTVQYDSNNLPIPTYSQFTVTEFACVYTGWSYAPLPVAGERAVLGRILQRGQSDSLAPGT